MVSAAGETSGSKKSNPKVRPQPLDMAPPTIDEARAQCGGDEAQARRLLAEAMLIHSEGQAPNLLSPFAPPSPVASVAPADRQVPAPYDDCRALNQMTPSEERQLGIASPLSRVWDDFPLPWKAVVAVTVLSAVALVLAAILMPGSSGALPHIGSVTAKVFALSFMGSVAGAGALALFSRAQYLGAKERRMRAQHSPPNSSINTTDNNPTYNGL